ncbi:GTP 3',8-cyclase MoaA [Kordiimonas sp. SCSIO 12603]|uniref:GTP 3',8-cyclase MoaA n=1 Tax=Kordiimonas sp. SCSIO 12603 TaxID=2829596 RepID=UPI0021077E9C|nr:GTP 3',8-cyclase MoaA [Kordiimonas sp. SCSIO 12603]UTW57757.1 GTP 3',8-cyclase MoaA [Kordiimonas sp. SCSIO 12603]
MSGLQSNSNSTNRLTDQFGRVITYLRLSVTDRCDLRCTYCMAEDMVFLPKQDVLTLEEMLKVSEAFIERGVKRIRLTGGEPLVRKNIMWLIKALGDKVKAGELDEITLTTNGTQLPLMADALYDAGVRRVNISLDTLDRETFKKTARRDQLEQVLKGIDAAIKAGLRVKINTVAMRGKNEDELPALLKWATEKGVDLTLIETMPLGDVADAREDTYLPLSKVKDDLEKTFTLAPSSYHTGGPARYFKVDDTNTKLGLITPLTNNFCDGCNRMRVTCTGRIYMCLGQDDHVDLRAALRGGNADDALAECLNKATGNKPRAHDFAMSDGKMVGKVGRHMSQTGG